MDVVALVAEGVRVLGPYWGWLTVVAILAAVGEVLKRVVTDARAKRSAAAYWYRATLALHPVLAGAVLGALPGMPLPDGVSGLVQSVLYYAGAGMASAWAYDVVKALRAHWEKP